jgi:class 3 adenylate cyclase
VVRRRGDKRGLVTLLFTDIVGSSEVASELGDQRWHKLQALHHAAVRTQIKRYGGHEVDTAGDGFFITFSSPARGVRCAFAIVRELRDLGLDVRAGLHIGEAQLAGEKVGGIAVTTAARVSAAAGPEQVFATDTIAHLVAGSGLEFTDLGSRELKGVPGRWELFSLDAVDGESIGPPLDPEDARDRRSEAAPPPAERTDRRTRRLSVAAGAVIVSIVIAVVLADRRTSTAPPSSKNGAGASESSNSSQATLGKILAGTNSFEPVVQFGQTTQTGSIVVLDGFAWVASSPGEFNGPLTADHLSKIRLSDGTIPFVRRFKGGCGSVSSCLVASDGVIWMVGLDQRGLILRGVGADVNRVTFNPRLIERFPQKPGQFAHVAGLVDGGGYLWAAIAGSQTLDRIDPSGVQPVMKIKIDGSIDGLAFGEGALWTIDHFAGTLTSIDPATNRPSRPIPLQGSPSSVAVGSGYVWVTDDTGNLLLRVDPNGSQGLGVVPVGRQPVAIAVGGNSVWVGNAGDSTVSEVDPTAMAVTHTIAVGSVVSSVTFGAGALWVGTDSNREG